MSAAAAMERGPLTALRVGGGLLGVGLAIVGVGAPAQGGPVALAGLLVTIYAIHRFGRLGPDDGTALDAGTQAATDLMWLGGLGLLAGVSFVIGGGDGSGAYVVLTAGAAAFALGFRRRGAGEPRARHRPRDAAPADEASEGEASDDEAKAPRPRKRTKRRLPPTDAD